MRKRLLKSFEDLKHGDLIISPIDKEVTAFYIDSEGDKYLANDKCIYPCHQFYAEDFFIYDGNKEVGEIDEEFFSFMKKEESERPTYMDTNNTTIIGSAGFLRLCKEKVVEYFNGLKDVTDSDVKLQEDDVYLVWYAKELQNHKALLSTPIADGRYYEITYNGDKNELYFDSYVKEKNICFELNGGEPDGE